MPLEVHYKNHKAWNGKFEDPEMKKEADQIGHLLMAIGIEELSAKTIDEVIIRKMILDRLYGDATYTLEHYRKIFEKHLGVLSRAVGRVPRLVGNLFLDMPKA